MALYPRAHYHQARSRAQGHQISHGVLLLWPAQSWTSRTSWPKPPAISLLVWLLVSQRKNEIVLALLSPRCHRRSVGGFSKLNSKASRSKPRNQRLLQYPLGKLHRTGSQVLTRSWLQLPRHLPQRSPRRSPRHSHREIKARPISLCARRSPRAKAKGRAKTKTLPHKKSPLQLDPQHPNVACPSQQRQSQHQCPSDTYPSHPTRPPPQARISA